MKTSLLPDDPTPPTAAPKARKGSRRSPRDPRWLARSAAGSAALAAAAGTADAALVQITQTNNYIADDNSSNLDFDLTGGMGGEFTSQFLFGFSPYSSVIIASTLSSPQRSARIRWSVQAAVIDNILSRTTFVAAPMSVSNALSATGLVDITFTDDEINGGLVTEGLVKLTSSYNGGALFSPGTLRVTIDSIIFDDASASLPSDSALPNSQVLADFAAGSIPEFVPVRIPEPSRVALLALGAAGVLAHRRRRKVAG